MSTILIAAGRLKNKTPAVWRGLWRTDSRHKFKEVVNQHGLPIGYKTKSAALAAAEYTVKAETSR